MQNKIKKDYERSIKREYETALAEALVKINKLNIMTLGPNKYEKTCNAYLARARKFGRIYRKIKSDYKLSPIDKEDDQMRISDFIENVKSGGFIDYDGSGVYASRIHKTDIAVYASDVSHGLRTDFTHIVWYNR